MSSRVGGFLPRKTLISEEADSLYEVSHSMFQLIRHDPRCRAGKDGNLERDLVLVLFYDVRGGGAQEEHGGASMMDGDRLCRPWISQELL